MKIGKVSIVFLVTLLISCIDKEEKYIGRYNTLVPCKVISKKKADYFEVAVKNCAIVLKNDNLAPFDSINIFELYPLRLSFYRDTFSNKLKGDIYFDMDTLLKTYSFDSSYAYSSIVGPYPYEEKYINNIQASKSKLFFTINIDRYDTIDKYEAYINLNDNSVSIDTSLFHNLNTDINPLYKGFKAGLYKYHIMDSLQYDSLKISFYKNQIDTLINQKTDKASDIGLTNSINYLKLSKYMIENP